MIMSKRTPDMNGTTEMGKPLLVAACEKGATAEKICLALIERGADINAIDKVFLKPVYLLLSVCIYLEHRSNCFACCVCIWPSQSRA